MHKIIKQADCIATWQAQFPPDDTVSVCRDTRRVRVSPWDIDVVKSNVEDYDASASPLGRHEKRGIT